MAAVNKHSWVLWLLIVTVFPCSLQSSNTDYPTANTSSSWINNDFIPRGTSNFTDGSILRPVLLNNSKPACGCGFYGNRTRGSFFFVVFAVEAAYDSTIDAGNSPVILWTANRVNPVGENATLKLTVKGDLVLKDADGTFVWSSNTSSKSVSLMRITSNGTLMLVDRQDSIIWQSWDYPTDTWFPDQMLVSGQKIIASVSASNWTPGPFFLSAVSENVFAFIQSNPPQMYRKILNDYGKIKQFKTGRLEVFNDGFGTSGVQYLSEIEEFQFMRLEPDGHLKVYQWDKGVAVEADDILTDSYGNCGYPTVCGNYGICSNGQCSCPIGKNGDPAYFRQFDSRFGCMEVTQLSCHSSHLHRFLELDGISYFGFTTVLADVDYKTCLQACLKNCSCKAALFQYDSKLSSTGNCSLPSQIFTLMSSPQGVGPYKSSSFIKVQNPFSPAPYPTIAVPPSPERLPVPKVVPEQEFSPDKEFFPQHSKKKPINQIALNLGPILAALVLTFLIIWICVRVIRTRKHSEAEGKANNADEDFENSLDMLSNLPMRFTYKDLESATNNFHVKLGGGGFGSVFEGTLGNDKKIAVKRLDRLGQGRKEFLAEVKTIGSIHHVNLVRLMGFCAEKLHRLLVYEHMSNGSLDKWIFHRTLETALEWEIRKKIILNIAKGLAYLHEDCRMRIAHLDVKPQNILLDNSFNAKLSDFGLARLIDKNQSQVITQMRGTRGYMAPEWLSRRITEKVDVYSFGVVMLEIVCGRKNLDFSQPEEDDHLLIHIVKRKAQENRLLDLVDKCSEDMQQHGEEAVKMIMVAIWCLHVDFTRRPSMSMVVKVLEGGMVMEPISDYSFLTSTVVEAPVEAVMVASTPQPASILSGPR